MDVKKEFEKLNEEYKKHCDKYVKTFRKRIWK